MSKAKTKTPALKPWQIRKNEMDAAKLRGGFCSPLKRQTVKYMHIIFSNIYLNGKHNNNSIPKIISNKVRKVRVLPTPEEFTKPLSTHNEL